MIRKPIPVWSGFLYIPRDGWESSALEDLHNDSTTIHHHHIVIWFAMLALSLVITGWASFNLDEGLAYRNSTTDRRGSQRHKGSPQSLNHSHPSCDCLRCVLGSRLTKDWMQTMAPWISE